MKKTKIALISGGPSSEHEVSLNSAKNILKNLKLERFNVLNIVITKDNIWIEQENKIKLSESEGIQYLLNEKIDLVFIIIHGEYGEDGRLQALLEKSSIKYTGTDSKSSRLAMDKIESAKVFSDSGLLVPEHFFISKRDWVTDKGMSIKGLLESSGKRRVVVKPTDRGSSVGVTIASNKAELVKGINYAFKYSENIMIQEYIEGRELTCGVIEGKDGKPIPLVPTEINPRKEHSFFNYEAKYVKGASVEITPPDLPKKLIKKIQSESVIAHDSIGCKHISRADFILSRDDKLYILEVNTIPGMTETSLIPQGAKALGLEVSELIELIIEASLRTPQHSS